VLRPDLGAIVGVERFLSEIQVTAYIPYAAYDVFPGGREFVMTTGPDVRSTINVIMNWQELDRVRAGRR
jgi:hypothetical protein